MRFFPGTNISHIVQPVLEIPPPTRHVVLPKEYGDPPLVEVDLAPEAVSPPLRFQQTLHGRLAEAMCSRQNPPE